MKILILFFTIFFINSCTIQQKTLVTVYGKTWYNYQKGAGSVIDIENRKAYNIDGLIKLPDSLEDQYIMVTGQLKDNFPKDTSTNRQIGFIKYSILNPTIKLIEDDSIKNIIDSAHHKCIEIRRFITRIQIDHVLDSLINSDLIILSYNDICLGSKLPALRYIHKGSKTIYFVYSDDITNQKIPEYFELSGYPEKKGSDYDIELKYIKRSGGIKVEKKYHLTGNSDKINIIPLL